MQELSTKDKQDIVAEFGRQMAADGDLRPSQAASDIAQWWPITANAVLRLVAGEDN